MNSYILKYAYRLQLTEGCISFHCDHLKCKSCPNYIYSTESNDKLIKKQMILQNSTSMKIYCAQTSHLHFIIIQFMKKY